MDTRVQELELQVHDLQSEVASLREELANMAEIASMACDEAQQAALRMDRMEQEWLSWGDTAPEGGHLHSSLDRREVHILPSGWHCHHR